MKVKITTLAVQMELKNNGMELEVRWPHGGMRGRCKITKSGLYWLRSGKHRNKVYAWRRISWNDFIKIMGTPTSLRAAIRAARA
jgi:hypothetical protein